MLEDYSGHFLAKDGKSFNLRMFYSSVLFQSQARALDWGAEKHQFKKLAG